MAKITLDYKEYKELEKKAEKRDYYKNRYEYSKKELEDFKESVTHIRKIMEHLLFFKHDGEILVSDAEIMELENTDFYIKIMRNIKELGYQIKLVRRDEDEEI